MLNLPRIYTLALFGLHLVDVHDDMKSHDQLAQRNLHVNPHIVPSHYHPLPPRVDDRAVEGLPVIYTYQSHSFPQPKISKNYGPITQVVLLILLTILVVCSELYYGNHSHVHPHLGPLHPHLPLPLDQQLGDVPGSPATDRGTSSPPLEEVVRILIHHCNELIQQAVTSEREYTSEAFKSEREHTTTKMALLMTSLDSNFKAITNVVVNLDAEINNKKPPIAVPNCGLQDRVATIEDILVTLVDDVKVSTEALEETIADVNLRTQTQNIYHEQLLYKLKHGLYETLSLINKDKCCPYDHPSQTHNPDNKPEEHPQYPSQHHPHPPLAPSEHRTTKLLKKNLWMMLNREPCLRIFPRLLQPETTPTNAMSA